MPSLPTKVWQPGVDKIEEGEELQCDPSAYNSLHAFNIGWPCLRFTRKFSLVFPFNQLYFIFKIQFFSNIVMIIIIKIVVLQFFSFDTLRDSLGLVRTVFPHAVYCVAGTQVSLH